MCYPLSSAGFSVSAGVLALFPIACSTTRPTPEGHAATEDYYNARDIRYEDRTYSSTVRTVQLFKAGFELSAPAIELGSTDQLVLRFDDLQPSMRNLNYTFIHCDADWHPSDLAPIQYIEGTFSDFLPTPGQSSGPLQPFLEYTVTFPNQLMRPRLSGNYIVKVYGDDPEDVVLTRRFLVYEQQVRIDARVQASRDVELRTTHQQMDLTVRHPGVFIQDPFSDLRVAVLQNMRWDDMRTGAQPKFIRDNELVYDFPPQTLFAGGNEWRNFDLKNLRYARPPVKHIEEGPRHLEEAFLEPDLKRNITVYFEHSDINGRYLVRNDLFDGDPLGADYVYVHFTLPMPEQLANGDVYVYGGFTDMQCRKDMRMIWDEKDRSYYLSALLKQGFVDYQYAFLPANSNVPDLTMIEGSHFETENDYLILAYLRDHEQRYDRLAGLRFLNSRRN